MRTRRHERGEGNLGCIFGLILLGLAIFVAWKMIPVKVRAADLRQTVVDEAKSAGSHTDERIRAAILNKAQELQLPVADDSIKISRAQSEITVDVDYVIPIEFPGYIYQWHINNHAQNPIF
jgi:hypothetical protein